MGRTGIQDRSGSFHSHRFIIRRHPSVLGRIDMDLPAEVRVTGELFFAIDVRRMVG